MPQKRMECLRLLLGYLAWIEHQFLSGIKDSSKAESLWRMMRGVGGARKSIHQSWLAKRLGLLCWSLKGVQEEIPSEEASTLQIGSVAFPPGQCTSLQLHPCYRLFDQEVQKLSLWENWGDERGLPWGPAVGTVQQVPCSRRRLLRRGLEFHACTLSKSAYTKNIKPTPITVTPCVLLVP